MYEITSVSNKTLKRPASKFYQTVIIRTLEREPGKCQEQLMSVIDVCTKPSILGQHFEPTAKMNLTVIAELVYQIYFEGNGVTVYRAPGTILNWD